MAVFRCNKCGHIREVGNDYIGKYVKCPKCENVTLIHDTVAFLKALIKKYISQTKELQKLHEEINCEKSNTEIIEKLSFDNINIHNTDIFTQSVSYAPIIQWFEERKIQIQVTPESVDTTGFFDEVSLLLGNNFHVLNFITNQIKYIQNKGYTNVKIELSKKNQKEIQQITSFCKSLYDYSFVAKYFYHKKDKIIRLTLQSAPKIRDFFNGIWMEWFTLMKLLELFRTKKIAPALSRNSKIIFPNGNSNELDIFFLTKKNIPVYIECKSGEFRQDINKYLSLRKQLNIEKKQFILCVFGLSQKQAQGMSSMYDLTFVNESTLIEHIETIV
jgi:phage FluMu protein Com/preprotein translocase subunit Sec61beta